MSTIQIITSGFYDEWFASIKDKDTKDRIQTRINRLRGGNFGDHKSVGDGVWELRFHFGGGIRIYYTFDGQQVVLLLAGGNKGTQKDDIKNAKYIASAGR